MGHCVASYNRMIARGRYMVYSVKSATGVRSTLGINVTKEGEIFKYSLSQHYEARNRIIEDQDVIDLANQIITLLNEGAQSAVTPQGEEDV